MRSILLKAKDIEKKHKEQADKINKAQQKAYDDMILSIMEKSKSLGIHMTRERAEAFNKMVEDTIEKVKCNKE